MLKTLIDFMRSGVALRAENGWQVRMSDIPPPRRRWLDCTELEDRTLLSAAPMAAVALTNPDGAGTTSTLSSGSTGATTAPTQAPLNAPAADVVLIDRNLPDSSLLAQAALPGDKVILYDGLHESADQVLKDVVAWSDDSHTLIKSISVLSHGVGGAFELGDQWISTATLPQTAAEWQELAQQLAPGASIYLFGCNVAAPGSDGQNLLNQLSRLTGAEVFASIDTTGAGWNWQLEAASNDGVRSSIAAVEIPLDMATLSQYTGDLGNAAPAGGQTLVNTTTGGSQVTSTSQPGTAQSVAADGSGNLIVTWTGTDANGTGVFAQMFDASGNPIGGEFQVNTTTAGAQQDATVARSSNGMFVILWSGQQGANFEVYGQLYDASGNPIGGEFQANTYTTSDQEIPSVAMDASGNFVAVWQSNGQDGSGNGIYGQRFDASGNMVGGEFHVSTTTAGAQSNPSVAMDAGGNFVVAWQSNGQDGSGYGIFGQRFDSSGNVVGGEFQVNTTTTNDQDLPDVAMNASGAFVVVWSSNGQDGGGTGVYGQRYDSSGNAVGSEFQINTTTTGNQDFASATMNANGSFVVTWSSNGQDGGGWGVFAQQFTSGGTPYGGETLVNTDTSGDQQYSSVASQGNGNYAIVWSGAGSPDNNGVYLQRYTDTPTTITVGNSTSAATAGGGASNLTFSDTVEAGGDGILIVSVGIQQSGANEHVTSITYGGQSLTLLGTAENNSQCGSELWYLLNPTAGTANVVITLSSGHPFIANATTYYGVDQTTPFGTFASATGNVATASVNVSSASGQLVIDSFITQGDSQTATPTGPAQAQVWHLSTGNAGGDALGGGSYQNGAASVTMSWSESNAHQWALIAVPLNPVANSAPVLAGANNLNSINEDPTTNPGTLVSSLISGQVTDADAGAMTGIAVTAVDNTNGTWQYSTDGGNNFIAFGTPSQSAARLLAADSNTYVRFVPNADWNGTVTGLTFRAWDQSTGTAGGTADVTTNGGSSAFSAATATAAITVNAVNDAPVIAVPGAQTINEDTNLVFSSGNGNQISISDVDANGGTESVSLSVTNGTLTLATTTNLTIVSGANGSNAVGFTGTITDINNALNGLTFTPAANFNGLAGLGITLNDQGNTGSGGNLTDNQSVAITVNAVNDAPVNTVPGPQSTNEDTALVFSSGNGNQISISDVDAGASSVQVTLTATNGSLTLSGTTNLTFTGGANGTGVMTFTGTIADINTALNGLSFLPTANYNGPATVQIVTNDQGNTGSGGAKSDTSTVNITVNAVNDPPVVVTTVAPLAYTENDPATVIDPGVTVSDVDNATLAGATVAISANYVNGQDVLAFTNTATITGNFDATTGVLTLTGTDTVANYQLALQSVTYVNTSENPSTATRTISFVANDGSANSTPATRDITVTSVDDGPVQVVPGSQTINENSPLVFSTANSNAISISDVDAGNNPVQVTLTATNGTLSLSGTTGLSFSSGSGTGDTTMTFTGTVSNINAALNGLTYNPTSYYSGSAALSVTTNDLGNTGVGGPLTASDTVNITVNFVNFGPSISVPAPQTEGTYGLVFSPANGNALVVSDASLGNNPIQITLTATNGMFTLGNTSGVVVISGSGQDSSSIVFTGTVTVVNNALNGLVFHGTTEGAGLQIAASDQGIVGGPVMTARADVPINQLPIYPAPVVPKPSNPTVLPAVVAPTPIIVVHTQTPAVSPRVSPSSDAVVPQHRARATSMGRVELAAVTITANRGDSIDLPHMASRVESHALRQSVVATKAASLDLNDLWSQINTLADQFRGDSNLTSFTFAVTGFTAVLSAGYVLWCVHGGSLLASVLSSLPAWKTFDPLPVLEFWEKNKESSEEDDEDSTDGADEVLDTDPLALPAGN